MAAFACGDDDRYLWRPPPDGAPADHVVARGLAWLGELHRERLWLSAS
jgi:ATP-dependent helicase/nuclease subunit A